ncbi:unnamed protein product [Orchesella dallaii]|uniref:Uncharacterized protein n=1 Tax=Orchesella dallaii TaxID=48710 RepID=A0ABP1RHU4_9HEXA
MALQILKETSQCNSSEVQVNKENNAESEFDSNSQIEDLKAQLEILNEKYFHLETNHEFLKDKFETVISSSVPAIQCEEILEQSKNLLEANQKLNKLNAGLLKVVKSGNFGKEGARGKVSKEAHKALNDLQKLSDELNIETKNSAKNLNRVEDFGKLHKKQLEEISLLVGCVDGHVGKAYESDEKLYRKEIEIDKLNGEILLLQNNLKSFYDEKEELQQIIQHCYRVNSQLKKDNVEINSKYEEKINNMTQQLKLKEAKLIEAQEKNEKLQKEMKNLEGTLVHAHKLDETVAQLQSRCEDLQQQTQDLRYLNRALMLEGRNSKCEQEQLKQKEADVIEAREKNEKLQEEKKNLEGILASERRQDETLAKLESRYDHLQQQNQDQLNRNQVLDEGRILVQRSQIRRLQKDPLRIQNINLMKDLEEANAEIIKLVDDTEQIKHMCITEIENPNHKLYQDQLKRNLDLECRISVLNSEIREFEAHPLQVQNEELKKNLKAADAKIIKLTTKIQQSKPKPEVKSLIKKFDNAKTKYQQCEERNKNLEQELANLRNVVLAAKLQQNLVSASKDSQMKNPSHLAGPRKEVMVAEELPYLRSGRKRKALQPLQSSLEMEQPLRKRVKRSSTIVPPVVLQRTDKTWAVTYTNMTLRQRKNVDQE